MLDRFYILRNCIRKALIGVKSSVIFTEDEFDTISHIITALELVKFAVEALCRQDANMLTAEATLKFMINPLKMRNSAVGKELIQVLSFRISQRRTPLTGALLYVHDP